MNVSVAKNSVKITASDSRVISPPVGTSPEPDSKGIINYFRPVDVSDRKNVTWRKNLGEALASYLLRASQHSIDKNRAILDEFPEGYKLYEHVTKKPGEPKKRIDTYLYGKHRFRSAKEFEPHMIWLASDRSLACECKYCMPSKTDRSSTWRSRRSSPMPSTSRGRRSVPQKRQRSKAAAVVTSVALVSLPSSASTSRSSSRSSSPARSDSRTLSDSSSMVRRKRKRSTVRRFVYRTGEIVFADLRVSHDIKLEDLARWNHGAVRYWPAIVWERERNLTTLANSTNELSYKIKLLTLRHVKSMKECHLRPWLSYKPDIPPGVLANTQQKDANVSLLLGSNMEAYCLAMRQAEAIARTYSPEGPYDYAAITKNPVKADAERAIMDSYQHYRYIWIATEHVHERDILRLKPEPASDSDATPTSESPPEHHKLQQEQEQYLKITSIYQHPNSGIQLTGDLYTRGASLKEKPNSIEDFSWTLTHPPEEEYTVDLEDIAGRFYPHVPDMSDTANPTDLKSVEERFLLLGDDWRKREKHRASNMSIEVNDADESTDVNEVNVIIENGNAAGPIRVTDVRQNLRRRSIATPYDARERPKQYARRSSALPPMKPWP